MEKHDIEIFCKNNGQYIRVPMGSTLMDIYDSIKLNMPYGVTSAKVNNKTTCLRYVVYNNKDVEFLDITSSSGMRTYTRSLFFVLYKAVHDLYPGKKLSIGSPVSNGYYCRLDLGVPLELEHVKAIHQRMREIIAQALPFERVTCHREEAIKLFEEQGMTSKVRLLKSSGSLYTSYYLLDGLASYYYGSLLVNTSQLTLFDLVKYYDGLLLRVPDMENPTRIPDMIKQEKMFEVFREHHHWQEILGVRTIGDLNYAATMGYTHDLINVSEALQEKRIIHIADEIQRRPEVRVILISGPSSSGKTTFSKRLAVQLMASGLKPHPISLDDYFVDREHTPHDENGEYDFESIYALNIPFFEEQMLKLLAGEEVELPRFNFHSGKSEKSGKKLRIGKNELLILEGIHALNPMLTADLPKSCKYMIYASALTTILLDDHNYIPTTDNRLLRRIVRDYKYRGYSALETIRRWPSVRKGEKKWIFPFQENADIMFNSALLFEFAILRNKVLPLLEQVPESEPEFAEAYRLRRFLSFIHPIDIEGLPPTSLLREFLGGSTFTY